jgi:hypothetical protein
MATKESKYLNDDRLGAVDRRIQQSTLMIHKSLKALFFDKNANAEKMLELLCSGIVDLTLASSQKRDLVARGAKDDLSKFVVKEMERVRKQYGLRKSDVYRDNHSKEQN